MVVRDDGSQNARTLSWTSELSLDVDPGKLSPRSRAVYDLIWSPMLEGIKPGEIAQQLGVAPSWVSDRLKEFHNELLFLQGVFPPLPQDEYDALHDSIAAVGVLQPVVVDEHGEVIDGRHRRHIAAELGVPCPTTVRKGLSLKERRELAVTLNATRRHMTRQQKRALVVAELMVGRDRSDRAIGRLAGVDGKTVGKVRAEIEQQEKVERQADGEAVVEGADSPQRNDEAVTERFQGYVECPCCAERLELWRRAGEWMLDQPVPAP